MKRAKLKRFVARFFIAFLEYLFQMLVLQSLTDVQYNTRSVQYRGIGASRGYFHLKPKICQLAWANGNCIRKMAAEEPAHTIHFVLV